MYVCEEGSCLGPLCHTPSATQASPPLVYPPAINKKKEERKAELQEVRKAPTIDQLVIHSFVLAL